MTKAHLLNSRFQFSLSISHSVTSFQMLDRGFPGDEFSLLLTRRQWLTLPLLRGEIDFVMMNSTKRSLCCFFLIQLAIKHSHTTLPAWPFCYWCPISQPSSHVGPAEQMGVTSHFNGHLAGGTQSKKGQSCVWGRTKLLFCFIFKEACFIAFKAKVSLPSFI